VALKRRGFTPKAIKEFVLSTGITKTESVLTWDDLIVHNRRILDPECNRYFFIDNPRLIRIEKAPEQNVKLKLHPDFIEKGVRNFRTKDEFYITNEDCKNFKDRKLYRLMDCLNFKKNKNKFIFDSKEYDKYKKHGDKIIHWLPKQKDLVKTEVLMPDKKLRKGLAETIVKNLKENDIIQFVRVGFCRYDRKQGNKLIFWYTHE